VLPVQAWNCDRRRSGGDATLSLHAYDVTARRDIPEAMVDRRLWTAVSESGSVCHRDVRSARAGRCAMEVSAIGMVMGAAAAMGLLWWGLHSSPVDADFIDPQADRQFRERTHRPN
jgi:hypothetical protein